MSDNDEIDKLLGLSSEGDAPISSFSARIRLAYLLGIITPLEAKVLNSLRSLRNSMAHRVNIDLLHPICLKYILQIIENSMRSGSEQSTDVDEVKESASKNPRVSEYIIVGFLISFQYDFDRRKASIGRLSEASHDKAGKFTS